jgi:hypothetical protein
VNAAIVAYLLVKSVAGDVAPAPEVVRHPHVVAYECEEWDDTCLGRHDDRVLALALMVQSEQPCEQAIRSDACRDAYRMIAGEVVIPRWAGLDDGCTFVMFVDSGTAELYQARTGQWRRVPNQGWRAAQFIGQCDVSKLPKRAPLAELSRGSR